MSDNKSPSWFKKASPKESHTASAVFSADKDQKSPSGNPSAIVNAMLWVKGDDGHGAAVNYSHLEGITTDDAKGHIRCWLGRAVADIDTDNISELVTLIGRRKLATLKTGQITPDINIKSIKVYSADNLPKAPNEAATSQ